MRISENGLRFTQAWELFAPVAYKATSDEKYYTYGYGHYGPYVAKGATISREAAFDLMRKDYAMIESLVTKMASPKLNQAQFDAICDLCFNAGTSYIKPDHIIGDFDDCVRDGDIDAIRRGLGQFIYQNKKPVLGLRRRAAGRIALFDGMDWKAAEAVGRAVK